MRNGFKNWVGQVLRSIRKNRSSATNDPNPNRLIKSLQGFSGIYDGKSHGITLITEDNCVIEYSTDLTNWGPDEPSICSSGKHEVYIKVRKKRTMIFLLLVTHISEYIATNLYCPSAESVFAEEAVF